LQKRVKLFSPTDEKQWKRKGIIPKRTKKKSMLVVEREEWDEIVPEEQGVCVAPRPHSLAGASFLAAAV
jgi:hypothetical protein